ncbi:uncharacterized protein SPSK_04748 [Sporothrix schenckii 1099-18]|uniref:Uncharacterized protein n=1 Tax=Sporothrix schenckii 1099-18 TaxID=1397361 RepID=A0A0F2M348_SPOSC|nr:uncharacterized protein SPSK_04748 [Sporothrix schenckii 1099-18]KJR83190.1 hypothetical protein SPSK_04748 [Sporothrix schenckii 1099-18]
MANGKTGEALEKGSRAVNLVPGKGVFTDMGCHDVNGMVSSDAGATVLAYDGAEMPCARVCSSDSGACWEDRLVKQTI